MRLHHLSHPWPTGYGVAAARLIRAVADSGVESTWAPITFDDWHPRLPENFPSPTELAHLRGPADGADVVVVHCVPELLRSLAEDRLPGSALVISTVWEAERVQDHWPDLLNRTDGVVVPTRWNADALRAAGVTVPVEVVPHAVSSDAPDVSWLAGLGVAEEDFLAHTVAAWTLRKDPTATVRAFGRAFGPGDGARMVCKTDTEIARELVAPPGPERRRWLTSWTVAHLLAANAPPPPVHLLAGGGLTHGQIAGLHHRSDCWISLPHAEGWDLGCFDAAAAGTPVITVGHGGPLEYLDPTASWLIGGETVPIPGLPGGTWIDPDLDAAVAALHSVWSDPTGARKLAAGQGERLRRTHSPTAVAASFADALRRMGING